MKAENITKSENGLIRLTLNGVKFVGTETEANAFLAINGCEPLQFKPQHWSSTKQCWINIEDMNHKHIENHIEKEWYYGESIVGYLKTNSCGFRDYVKQLISHYEKISK